MLLSRFLGRLQDYGLSRAFLSDDIKFAFTITVTLALVNKALNIFVSEVNVVFVNNEFVSQTVPFLSALLSFIVTGFAILVSLTDEEFLAELADLEIYPKIIFQFEYNILLVIITALVAAYVSSYTWGRFGDKILFYIFLFFLFYTVTSITELLQLISNIGINKASFEKEK